MSAEKIIHTIAIAGNPNSGKTTLFNSLTGGNQRIGNWPGVTVEKKEGTISLEKEKVRIIDLPGIYSLSIKSEDERVARDYILSGDANLVINIVDATNLERNLYLTTQLIEMQVPVLLVLNMTDLAEKKEITINPEKFEQLLGCPVISISAVDPQGIHQTRKAIGKALLAPRVPDCHIEYPNEVEDFIVEWKSSLSETSKELGADERWVALKLLEEDTWVKAKVVDSGSLDGSEIEAAQNKIEKILKEPADIILADYRYGFIHSISKKIMKKGLDRKSVTDKIDKVVMNRVLGIPIFLFAMYLVFWVTISIGGSFIDFFDLLFGAVFVDGFKVLLESIHAPQWLIALLADGVGAGIQTVATFIPIIFFMFFSLSILEDSGYMARAAYVMDGFMRILGLPGKSFVPMIVGFGCTVPAIMSTRTLERKRDRFLTMFMVPFMSCGARFPVYALFGAAFFGRQAGWVIFSLYLAGIVLAVGTGLLLKGTIFRGEQSYFIMELPPYHLPRLKHIMIHTWIRLKVFILRAGKIIIIAVVLLGALNSLGTDGTFGNEDTDKSVLASIGRAITPVFTPMGIEKDNWAATVGLFTGLFAKEAIVGTLNSLYAQSATVEEDNGEFSFVGSIGEAFKSLGDGILSIFSGITDPLGAGIISDDENALAEELSADNAIFERMRDKFNSTAAYGYLLFVLLYFPCVAALGAAIREMGPFFGWLLAGYLTLLAWSMTTLFYQVVAGHQLLWILIPLGVLLLIYGTFALLGRRVRVDALS
ncbi:MAG: Fe(2+) transporter permease subunit FeoB [Spirochaetales bacterium]|nr:Fe(2+) transporter permease subunit FeoB [Spirochaetales bacterium]